MPPRMFHCTSVPVILIVNCNSPLPFDAPTKGHHVRSSRICVNDCPALMDSARSAGQNAAGGQGGCQCAELRERLPFDHCELVEVHASLPGGMEPRVLRRAHAVSSAALRLDEDGLVIV